jgi:hypothetical protein
MNGRKYGVATVPLRAMGQHFTSTANAEAFPIVLSAILPHAKRLRASLAFLVVSSAMSAPCQTMALCQMKHAVTLGPWGVQKGVYVVLGPHVWLRASQPRRVEQPLFSAQSVLQLMHRDIGTRPKKTPHRSCVIHCLQAKVTALYS